MPAKEKKPLRSTVARANAFLAAYRKTANLTASARAAGISVRAHYHWLVQYPKYQAAFERSHLVAKHFLKDKAIEYATVGHLEPVFFQGQPCGAIRRHDSGLHQMLLRGAFPEEFGRKIELSGKDGGAIQSRLEVSFVEPAGRTPFAPGPKTAP
jgi:hypothetical protein